MGKMFLGVLWAIKFFQYGGLQIFDVPQYFSEVIVRKVTFGP